MAGGGLSFFVGGSVVTFEVEELTSRTQAYYTLMGADFGVGYKVAPLQGPSSWTGFEARCGLRDFHGYAILKSGSVAVGAGVGIMVLDFITGPAAGLQISGVGWLTGVGASAIATHGYMMLRE